MLRPAIAGPLPANSRSPNETDFLLDASFFLPYFDTLHLRLCVTPDPTESIYYSKEDT
jgi:hypothetical protein